MSDYDSLQPAAVWRIFGAMSRIPRCSGNETAVQAMFRAWANQRGLAVKEDEVGNLLITIPATPGHERAPTVLIQGHVDMVCEKNAATRHDFTKDPIPVVVEGDWVTAAGTTLGADNGIGVAMGLAIAEDALGSHGPVEVLLTVDEERGLTGAAGVRSGFFTARQMINLDSEEDTAVFIGCAGGRDTEYTVPHRSTRVPRDSVGRRVSVTGLQGGHSGLDIHRNRGNAIKILARGLQAAGERLAVRLVDFDGGSMRNAIPREATARVVIPRDQSRLFKRLVEQTLARIKAEELAHSDSGLQWRITPVKAPRCCGLAASKRSLDLLTAIPNGVCAMSQELPDLVETSTNLGVVKTVGNHLRIVSCSRSSVMSALDGLVNQLRALGDLAGVGTEQPPGYPGWQPNLDSRLLAVTKRAYAAAFATEPELKAIHAGLECGLLTEKYPELEIVSFGPNITGAHSPDERVQISSVQRIWRLLNLILEELARA